MTFCCDLIILVRQCTYVHVYLCQPKSSVHVQVPWLVAIQWNCLKSWRELIFLISGVVFYKYNPLYVDMSSWSWFEACVLKSADCSSWWLVTCLRGHSYALTSSLGQIGQGWPLPYPPKCYISPCHCLPWSAGGMSPLPPPPHTDSEGPIQHCTEVIII